LAMGGGGRHQLGAQAPGAVLVLRVEFAGGQPAGGAPALEVPAGVADRLR
jgi:hypothetical protein